MKALALYTAGFTLLALGVPADGVLRAVLALAGMASVTAGYLVHLRGGAL